MVTRRFISTSDDEDDSPPPPPPPSNNHRKRKLHEESHDDDDDDDDDEKEEEDPSSEEDEDDSPVEDAKPIGEPVRVSGKGKGRKKHFHSFEFDGDQYNLEDPVLLVPEVKDQKPYVAIIKDITQNIEGSLMITGQWFYRPDEAEKKGGGSWQSNDTRELFYSFHRDDVPAESVMHKCVVHFVPIHKQIPTRKQYPGFIVQKVYDTDEMKLWKLTDKDYEDGNQQEIDELVQKTLQRLGDLPDIETDEAPTDHEDLMRSKRILKKKSISHLDVSREDETSRKSFQHLKPETPGSTSEHYRILVKFNALTGDTHRDKGLVMLLQNVQYLFDTDDIRKKKDKCSDNSDAINNGSKNKSSEIANESKDKVLKNSKSFVWPDVAVPAVVALEKASHDTFSSDYQKYSQKLRQLAFNLKNNAFLLHRLLDGELEASKILSMTPTELKEGLTAEEISKSEPDEPQHMQMTDARCKLCSERTVGVRDIIRAGHADRYMLECTSCGHSWSASRDAVSVLTLDASDSKRNVGSAPWATAKFEDAGKKLASPRESDKSANDIFMPPVLEAQRSFGKSRKDENVEASRRAD
ncbi:bromo-adjacent proteiny (BAH) domain-containing protein [Trifolium repens]|nr:bromo-adjacent proteiny (BAH) domain-containing protein [Trifolium repens]